MKPCWGSARPPRDWRGRWGGDLDGVTWIRPELAGALVAATVGERASSVWVLAGNERALAFYAREGWVADGRERTHEGSGLPEVRLLRPGGASLHGGRR